MPFPVGAAIMGGSMLAGGLFNSMSSRRQSTVNARRQREHDMRMAKMQNKWNRQQSDIQHQRDSAAVDLAWDRDQQAYRDSFAHDVAQSEKAFAHDVAQSEKAFAHDRQQAEYAFSKELEMWNRQNEYNDPSAQMERLKAAGLNPHMVYGNGVTGNTSGSMPGYSPASYNPSSYSPAKHGAAKSGAARYSKAPQGAPKTNVSHLPFQVDLSGVATVLNQYQDFKIKQAQTDNVAASTRNIDAQTTVNLAKQSGILTDNQRKKLDLSIAEQLEETTVDAAEHKLDLLKEQITTEQKKQLIQKQEELMKREDVRWRKMGITPQDALWQRQIFKMFDSIGIGTDKMTKDVFDMTKDVFKWLKR
jgi:hypothetical protein